MLAPKRFHRRSGTACVELAMVLPVLVMLLTGIWEIGRMVEASQVVSNAAREGARCAANGHKTVAEVDAAVKNYLAAAGLDPTGYTMSIYNLTANPTPAANAPSDDPTATEQLDHLRCNVTVPFNNVKWIFLDQLTNINTLSGTADWYVMRDQPLVVDSTMPN